MVDWTLGKIVAVVVAVVAFIALLFIIVRAVGGEGSLLDVPMNWLNTSTG